MAASPGSSSIQALTTPDTTKTDVKSSSKTQIVALDNDSESTVFASQTSSSSNQIDSTTPNPGFEIPQWKKDLIQRRKINIAKTIAAANGNSFREELNNIGSLEIPLTNIDLKKNSIITSSNNSDKTINSPRTNTNDDFNRSNTSHHIPNTSSVTKTIENMPKTPTTLTTTTQSQIKLEMLRGGHYTHFNKKSSEGFLTNHNEKLLDTSVYSSSVKTEHQQSQDLVMRSTLVAATAIGLEQNSSSSSSSSSILPLPQENVRFRKNLTDQLAESPSTTSSDSLLSSISDSSAKASTQTTTTTTTAELYKKQNKDSNCRNNSLCASEEHHSHIFQSEPAFTTTNINKGNTKANNKLLNDHEKDDCDNDQVQHEFQCISECDRVNLVCEINSNELNAKEIDSKLLISIKRDSIINNCNNSSNHSTSIVNNKQTCGVVNSSSVLAGTITTTTTNTGTTSASQAFKKNPHIGYVNDVTAHHNFKINSKLRSIQNSSLTTTTTTTTTIIPAETTSAVANNESSAKVTNNKKKMVAVQEKNDITNKELDFDPSEELQYGPGIVSKLRCRYLSLALRQSVEKQRSPIDYLRRATSLNNLLDGNNIHEEEDDEDDDAQETANKEKSNPSSVGSSATTTKESANVAAKENDTVVVKNGTHLDGGYSKMGDPIRSYKNRSRNIKRGNDSLKRARSVEALLCEKSPWNFSNSQPTTVNNGASDSVTIDDKINNARERLLSGTDSSPPKRLTSIIDDTERPPPDLVKQTLKIFEASANRRAGAINRNGGGGEVATKVANYKSFITQNKPSIPFAKPPVIPKILNQKPKPTEIKTKLYSPTTTTTTSQIVVPSVQQSEKIIPQTNTKTSLRPKMDAPSSIRKIGCASSVVEALSDNSTEIIESHNSVEKTVIPIDSTASSEQKPSVNNESSNANTPEIPSHKDKFFSESSEHDSEDDDDSMDGEYVINKEESESTIPATNNNSTLDAIYKAGTSQSFSYTTNTTGSSSLKKTYHLSEREPLHDIPTLVANSSSTTTTVKQIGVIRPLLAEHSQNQIMNKFPEEIPYDKSSSTLTSREIEKNRINNEKKINKDINEVASTLKKINVSTTSADSCSSAITTTGSSVLITKKKRFGSANVPENNTMVFNFKDRKEVPDYIESDGLIFKHKRELPKPNEPGFVLLGDLSRETSTDPEDEWPMCPPSPCDVEFENAHIVIDGKSNIKSRPKEANFRVQFNDSLNSTFEYPSETSLLENTNNSYAEVHSYEVEENDSPIVHHHVQSEEIIQLPQKKKILGNTPLGSAPLGCYTPLTAKTDNLFQLGVTRIPSTNPDKNGNGEEFSEKSSADLYDEHDKPLTEYLKPASDDLTIVYSEGSLKTDLLY